MTSKPGASKTSGISLGVALKAAQTVSGVQVASRLGYLTVQGWISQDEVLAKVNTDQAKALIVTTPDPDRILACTLMARALNPTLLIYTVTFDSGNTWLTYAGASEVVFGDELIANEVINRLDAAMSKQ